MAEGSDDGALGLLVASTGRRLQLKAGRTIVGRAPGCDVVLDDPAVQPEHFAVQHTRDGFQLMRLPAPDRTRACCRRARARTRARRAS